MRVVNTVPVRLGLMLRPQIAEPRPYLGASSQETVALDLRRSFNAFEGEGRWLASLRPADWTQKAKDASYYASSEITNLKNNIIGKLGTDEGEKTAAVLLSKWQDLKDKADYDLANAPSAILSWWDSVSRYFSDFGRGYTGGLSSFTSAWSDAWGIVSNAAIENAGPVLKTYYDAVNRAMFLRDDLAQAKASGQVPQDQIIAQDAKIRDVEASLDQIRKRFATLSGGESIDAAAQGKFGNFQSLGIGPVVAVAIAVAAIALAWAIHVGGSKAENVAGIVFNRDPSKPETWNNSGPLGSPGSFPVGAIGLVALIAIPLYLMNKD